MDDAEKLWRESLSGLSRTDFDEAVRQRREDRAMLAFGLNQTYNLAEVGRRMGGISKQAVQQLLQRENLPTVLHERGSSLTSEERDQARMSRPGHHRMFNAEEVRAIRHQHRHEHVSIKKLAQRANMSRSSMSALVNGTTYKWVEDEASQPQEEEGI